MQTYPGGIGRMDDEQIGQSKTAGFSLSNDS
ncbi:hypothetical protein J2S62_000030 [Enteractinococcus fodinae]|uniref:Uncharacterized protein n=1 Tax=Enteractinococcus fodinae TaxID=684663 RepID=A0ABU2AWP2_9MICC|nr:hypothetical protein [Enteractinococcus fodinae]